MTRALRHSVSAVTYQTLDPASRLLIRRLVNRQDPLQHKAQLQKVCIALSAAHNRPNGSQACLLAAPGWTASPGRCQVGRPAALGRWLGVAALPPASPWQLAACLRTACPAGGRRPGCWHASAAAGCPSGWTPPCGGRCAAPTAQAQCRGEGSRSQPEPSARPVLWRAVPSLHVHAQAAPWLPRQTGPHSRPGKSTHLRHTRMACRNSTAT